MKPLVLPAWSPNLNAFAERFVESAKSECLERMVLLGESHLPPFARFLILIMKTVPTRVWATN